MNDDNSTLISEEHEGELVYIITFTLLMIIEIPSIICTIFILFFFLINWSSMMTKVLHNHAIFLLMIISLIYITLDLPFIISYYHLHYDRFRTKFFCLWWYWLDYTIVVISLYLTATASIQRHILVFHSAWLHRSQRQWIFHYIPLICCLIYPTLFTGILIVFYPCETLFEKDIIFCPFPCYTDVTILSYIDWMINVICPVLIIVIANMTLICRTIYSMEKFRRPQTRAWKKRRKLILQLLAFACLYVIGWGPSTTISIIQTLFLPDLYEQAPDLYYINNSSYFICPLQPFICFFALPELLKLIKHKRKRRAAVANVSISMLGSIRP